MRYIVIDLDETIGRTLLAQWLRHHASEIAKKSADGRASVSTDMRYIADQIESQSDAWEPTR